MANNLKRLIGKIKSVGKPKLETDYSFGLPALFEEKIFDMPFGYHHVTLNYIDELGHLRKSEMFGENRRFLFNYLVHLTEIHGPGRIKVEVTPYSYKQKVQIFEEDLGGYVNLGVIH